MTFPLARNWWAVALRGVLAIIFGLLAFFWTGATLAVLVLFFGAYALVDGIFATVAAIRAAERHDTWWPLVLEGIAGIAAGVITFIWPAITALVLVYIIGAWAIVTGIFEVMAAVRLRREITGEWLLALSGMASVAFGVILFIAPGAGALAVTWLIGAYAVLFGLLLLGLAVRLRRLSQRYESELLDTARTANAGGEAGLAGDRGLRRAA